MLAKTLDIKIIFQRTFENGEQRGAATDRVRQAVPGARFCDGECIAFWDYPGFRWCI